MNNKMADQILNLNLVEEIEKHPCLYNYTLTSYSRKDITEKAWNEIGAKINIPGRECKERWKNLRAVFTRHMKTSKGPPVKYKKPYYLAEAMQFATPFIKRLNYNKNNSDNLPAQTETTKQIESEDEENPLALNDKAYHASVPRSSVEYINFSTGSPQPSQSPLSAPPLSPQSCSLTSPSRRFKPINIRGKISEEDDLGQTYADFARTRYDDTDSQQEANKMFLLSLLPDMNQMSLSQTRQFKRKIMDLIDDVLENTSNVKKRDSSSSIRCESYSNISSNDHVTTIMKEEIID
ncbi:hypothetical protein K1T71_001854 [Dendrolimus kikuchii]|uniref:Uncharacterized protein n=1 Tax=Dendrolimus kikuchii TaxID=765133 RepID=A0ACC1DFB2_9NEOP|nr:hypothetical protein K1T71_001854 [Dendrolimus kikuchii]